MPSALFSPLTLRAVEFRNRLWVSPMCQYSIPEHDGIARAWHQAHLGGLARGGAGLVMIEATGVVPEGRISLEDLGLWNDAQRDALAPIVSFMHGQGAKVGIQLAHAGRKASVWSELSGRSGSMTDAEGGWTTVAPSPIPFGAYKAPTALDEAGIRAVVAAFADAARRAVDAGIDVVEVHAAHGYLLHEFLSPLSNRREDRYGGSLENRARVVIETITAVRAEVGEDVPVFVRLSATDWVEGGLTVEDSAQVAAWAADAGADLVDVSTGGNSPDARIPVGPGYQVSAAARIRAASGVPVSAVGMIDEAFQAEQIIVTGQADAVMMGRGMLRDPHFPLHAAKALHAEPPVPPAYSRAFRR